MKYGGTGRLEETRNPDQGSEIRHRGTSAVGRPKASVGTDVWYLSSSQEKGIVILKERTSHRVQQHAQKG